MVILKIYLFAVLILITLSGCSTSINVKEEDKIFHAAPVNSGFGVIYWELYKDNKYQFCDGDFMDAGCYTGLYSLSGDTIIFHELKKHKNIPTNKFIIKRYSEMDSSYWIWKYPKHLDWQTSRQSDFDKSSTGDILPLDKKNEIKFDINNYFLIRLDSLKK